jgi:hypothetical protein
VSIPHTLARKNHHLVNQLTDNHLLDVDFAFVEYLRKADVTVLLLPEAATPRRGEFVVEMRMKPVSATLRKVA